MNPPGKVVLSSGVMAGVPPCHVIEHTDRAFDLEVLHLSLSCIFCFALKIQKIKEQGIMEEISINLIVSSEEELKKDIFVENNVSGDFAATNMVSELTNKQSSKNVISTKKEFVLETSSKLKMEKV